MARKFWKAVKAIADHCKVIREDWNGFNLLHYAAARVGALDIGFVPQANGCDMAGIIDGIANKEIKFVYLLGVDEIDMSYFGGRIRCLSGPSRRYRCAPSGCGTAGRGLYRKNGALCEY